MSVARSAAALVLALCATRLAARAQDPAGQEHALGITTTPSATQLVAPDATYEAMPGAAAEPQETTQAPPQETTQETRQETPQVAGQAATQAPAGDAPAAPSAPIEPLPDAPPPAVLAAVPASAPNDVSASAREARAFDEHKSALESLARAHPDRVEIRSIGRSRGGRELTIAVVGDARVGAVDARPALILCADLARSDVRRVPGNGLDPALPARGPESVLRSVEDLLARAASDPEVASLLQAATIYVLPAPDPDRWFGADPEFGPTLPRAVDLDRNFPIDWQPVGRGGGRSGPYPLSEPESRALARFVQSRTNVGALYVLPTGAPTLLAPATEAVDAAAGVERARPRPLDPPALASGSFARFCAELAGAPVFREPLVRDPLLKESEAATAGASLVPGTRPDPITTILRSLPRLALGAPIVERLRANLWVVDLVLENRGTMPTAGPEMRARWTGPSVWLKAAGARVVSVAAERPGRTGFLPLDARPEAWFLADLEGGGRTTVRLVVEAAENATLELAFESFRAGITRTSVALR